MGTDLPRVSLRLRLTLIYGLLLGIAFAVAALLMSRLVADSLLRELDDTLSVNSAAVHKALNVTDEGFDIAHLTSRSLQIPVNEFASSGIYIQVLNQRGSLVVASANLQDTSLPIDPTVIADGLAAKPSLVTLAVGRGEHLRVLSTPMIHGEHVAGLLQVAASLHTINTALHTLGYQLAFGTIGSWLLAMTGLWWVVGRALRPVLAISEVAEGIGATGDVGKRITYDGARDELGVLAATFNRMLERIQRSFAANRQFVADSSHQLATPLTVIRGNAELLGVAVSAEDRQECISAIKTEVERMDKIVGDLLTLAQLDARPGLKFSRVRLDDLAREVAGQVQSIAGTRSIAVEASEVNILGDIDRLSELLFNLLHNSIKYSPDCSNIAVRVEETANAVGGGRRTAPTHEAKLTVKDQGFGIPAQEIERIFERFHRVNRSYAQTARGAGLGLAIVKAVAEAHGGRVEVKSIEGSGSDFAVFLPLAPADTPAR